MPPSSDRGAAVPLRCRFGGGLLAHGEACIEAATK